MKLWRLTFIISGLILLLGLVSFFIAGAPSGTPLSTFRVSQGGTGQTSFTSGQLLYGSGTGSIQSVATTTASCSGSASCTSFSIIGNSPITISATGGSGGSGTVSTSTSETSGFLSYWTSNSATPALLGQVATTSLTATSPLSLSSPVAKVGGSNSVFTIATTTTSLFSGTAGQILAFLNNGWTGTATTTFSNGLTYSGGNVTADLGTSITSVEILDDEIVNADINSAAAIALSKTALIAGTNITLSTNTLNVDDAFILNTGDIGTGVYDFGGATSFEIPNGAPTVDTTGEIGIDTTSGQFKWSYSASTLGIKLPYETLGFAFASSTQGAATTTLYLAPAPFALTVNTVQCDFSNFMGVSLYDGTSRANYLEASSTIGTFTYTTNNTFTAGEAFRVDVGTSTAIGASVAGGCTFKYTPTAD